MEKVFIVQFDWSTTDCGSVDLYAFNEYDKAYNKFIQLISDEMKPENSWVGDIEFDEDGYPIDDHYEFDFKDKDSCESELWWHITDKNDWYQHSFIDLRILEVK